jgi:hypothetical protein
MALPLDSTNSEYPSGAALAKAAAAKMPPALGRFSITTCWPVRSVSFCPRCRMVMSARPPGPNGMTMRMGRSGNAARAENECMIAASSDIAASVAGKRRAMI